MNKLKKFTSIAAFGDCSFAGCEIPIENSPSFIDVFSGKISIPEVDNLTKPFSFPNLLAKKLNVPCYNFAMSGTGHKRGLRKLTNTINELDNCLILFALTHCFEQEFYRPDMQGMFGVDDTGFLSLGLHWEDMPYAERTTELNKIYLDNLLTSVYNNLNETCMLVESLCHYNNLDVIHIPVIEYATTNFQPKHLFNFDNHNFMLNWCDHEKFAYTEFGHYEAKMHTQLAEMLFQYINKRQID